MKHKKNILMIIMALVLVFALAACGQNTEEAIENDNMEKSEEPMETVAPHDDDSSESDTDEDSMSEDDDSMEHEDSDEDSMDDEDGNELKVFTLEELSTFNGLDGKPAYVAVDGVVYDFTNLGAWRNGKHNGFTAGKDLTDEIINVSPHGVKNLEGVPIVGSLVE